MISERQGLMDDRLKGTSSQIAAFCQRWNITELVLFSSALRDDFRPDSEIDLLVVFGDEHGLIWDDWMKQRF